MVCEVLNSKSTTARTRYSSDAIHIPQYYGWKRQAKRTQPEHPIYIPTSSKFPVTKTIHETNVYPSGNIKISQLFIVMHVGGPSNLCLLRHGDTILMAHVMGCRLPQTKHL
jgi:hypothetical protein